MDDPLIDWNGTCAQGNELVLDSLSISLLNQTSLTELRSEG